MQGKITFPGNPWPEGHALKSLNLAVRLHEARDGTPAHASLDLNLKSEDYHFPQSWEDSCEAADKQFEDNEDISDWEAINVWNNYHACHIESASSHHGLLLAKAGDKFDSGILDGISRKIDPVDTIDENDDDYFDARAFTCYILGHDAVAGHDLQIKRDPSSGHFNINWSGKVAKAYAGDFAFDYDFDVVATQVPFLGYRTYMNWPDAKAVSEAQREARFRKLAQEFAIDADALLFEAGKYAGDDRLIPRN